MNKDKTDTLIGVCVVGCLVVAIGFGLQRWAEPAQHPDSPPPTVFEETLSPAIDLVQGPQLSAVGEEARLSEYAHLCYPPGSVAYRLGESRIKRDVSPSLRLKIIARDGGRCLICGTESSLQVDHMRALMNGGGNEPSNLACLCQDCNGSSKKSIDNSIRRQRDKALREQRRRERNASPSTATR